MIRHQVNYRSLEVASSSTFVITKVRLKPPQFQDKAASSENCQTFFPIVSVCTGSFRVSAVYSRIVMHNKSVHWLNDLTA